MASHGAQLIVAERERQIDVEGYTPEHDDEHSGGAIAFAAACYAAPEPIFRRELHHDGVRFRDPWPEEWTGKWDKRPRGVAGNLCHAAGTTREERVRCLVKAGALIAAEIDRLERSR